eukprot:1530856-Lingulodinium_polyedra.AAC.1
MVGVRPGPPRPRGAKRRPARAARAGPLLARQLAGYKLTTTAKFRRAAPRCVRPSIASISRPP